MKQEKLNYQVGLIKMKIEGMTEQEVKLELEFIMQLVSPMKQFLLDNICNTFENHAIRSRVLFNFLANFICNTIHENSEQAHMKENIMEIVKSITDWVNFTHEGMIYNYDPKTQKMINKEEMH